MTFSVPVHSAPGLSRWRDTRLKLGDVCCRPRYGISSDVLGCDSVSESKLCVSTVAGTVVYETILRPDRRHWGRRKRVSKIREVNRSQRVTPGDRLCRTCLGPFEPPTHLPGRHPVGEEPYDPTTGGLGPKGVFRGARGRRPSTQTSSDTSGAHVIRRPHGEYRVDRGELTPAKLSPRVRND